MTLHHVRHGSGPPLVLVHGLGSRGASWDPIIGPLAARREVIVPDLPGHGQSPSLDVEPSVANLTDALAEFLDEQDLSGADLVGSSLGARMVLELARRGIGRDVVALDPGGFWSPGEVRVFHASLKASIVLVRALQPIAPTLAGNPVTRTALLAQLSARPWALPKDVVVEILRGLAETPAFDATLDALAFGPTQEGAPAGSLPGRATIVWGRRDAITLPRQAPRAMAKFPDAELVWVERSGHFPHLDRTDAIVDLVLERTAA